MKLTEGDGQHGKSGDRSSREARDHERAGSSHTSERDRHCFGELVLKYSAECLQLVLVFYFRSEIHGEYGRYPENRAVNHAKFRVAEGPFSMPL